MKYSLRTKLSISYIFIALVCIALISFFTNGLLEKQFRNYVEENQRERNLDYVSLMSQQYKGNGKWDVVGIENIGINALEQGMVLRVRDWAGNVLWDAAVHNKGMCNQMLAHIMKNMASHYGRWEGKYEEHKYRMNRNKNSIGVVEIGYYGPFYFSDNDLTFINMLNKLLLGVGILSLVFAFVLGAVMAKRISTPISRVIDKAQLISEGKFGESIEEKSNTKEISQLIKTINVLAKDLEKQEMLRRRLTSDVAHELRTPLATLQSHMEAMIDGIWEPNTERLSSCHEEIIRLSRMVQDIQKLTRYESEKLELTKERFDLSELSKSIIRNFESKFREKEIQFSFDGEEEIIYADKDKVSQVLVNLLSNALKYTPQNGCVSLKIKPTENAVEISMEDSGVGINEEELPYIFERFYRADKSRNRMTGGAGIGLSIVKAIVEAHNGSIAVQSKPGEGTKFIVSIPNLH